MKNGVFWDVTPCGSCKNRRFGGATWCNVTEDTILHSHRRENLKSYIFKGCFQLLYQHWQTCIAANGDYFEGGCGYV
jgi:hypothetical protein